MTSKYSEHTARVHEFFEDRVEAYDAFYDPPSALARGFNRVFRKDVYRRRDQALIVADRYGCRDVLDVGCGSGQNSVWWARRGVDEVEGVDISARMVEEATELAERAGVQDRCRFKALDFCDLKTGPKFDMVAALGVFDYVEEPIAFLRHMSRFATRVIYGSFPGWTLLRSPLRKLRYSLRGCPTHFYRKSEVRALFDAVGFGRFECRPVSSGVLAWAVHDQGGSAE